MPQWSCLWQLIALSLTLQNQVLMVWLIALAAVAAVFACIVWLRRHVSGGEEQPAPVDGECCGQHAVCERDSLLAGVSRRVEYYDDEELDRYRGVAAGDYTDEQAEEFRDVLYTMSEDDVLGWCRSLQLRGIELPDQLRGEVLLIVGEHRFAGTRK